MVFSDPEIAAVGLTTKQARERGIELATSRIKLPDVIARPWTYVPLAVLRDTVAQFPTFSEAYLEGVEALEATG